MFEYPSSEVHCYTISLLYLRTNKTNCQAYVAIRASKCGTKLEVIAVDNVHNHEISEKSSEKLPHLRKLSKAEKREVITYII